MNDDLTFLARRAEAVEGRPEQRLAEVRTRIRTSRRRRAAGAVVGVSALVLALLVGIDVLTGPAGRPRGSAPPQPAGSATSTPAASHGRPLVYSDDVDYDYSGPDGTGTIHIGVVHIGDDEVTIDQTLPSTRRWRLDVTDAGVVFDKGDGSIWFSDGSAPRRVAAHACPGERTTASGSSGTWATWFDCTGGGPGELVVLDTATGQVVARTPVSFCRSRTPGDAAACRPDDIVGDHVYFSRPASSGAWSRPGSYRFDVSTGVVAATSPRTYDDDLRAHARGLVYGRSWRTATAAGLAGDWLDLSRVGGRLVLAGGSSYYPWKPGDRLFATPTGREVRLRVPTGPTSREPGASTYSSFGWLDDDRLAVVGPTGGILTCSVSRERCTRVVAPQERGSIRIVPGLPLPG